MARPSYRRRTPYRIQPPRMTRSAFAQLVDAVCFTLDRSHECWPGDDHAERRAALQQLADALDVQYDYEARGATVTMRPVDIPGDWD